MKKLTAVLCFLLLYSFGSAQINLQTGSATYSLPMFNWQDHKSRLNALIALSYNSGNGLKTGDVASNVGQGWGLIAGGLISRIQVGEPDDQRPREGSYDDESKYPAGYLYNTKDVHEGAPLALGKYPLFGHRNQIYKQHNTVAADRELDYFSFQFNGRSGIFVLNKKNNTGILLGNDKIKISFSRNENVMGVRTTIDAFTIIDENGLIYRFRSYLSKSRVLKQQFTDESYTHPRTQPNLKAGKVYHESFFENSSIVNPEVVTAWHLQEIEDGLTHRKINFSYYTRTIDADAGVDITFNGSKDYITLSKKKNKAVVYDIDSVSFPDGHSVKFLYGKPRADLNGGEALTGVKIRLQTRVVTKFSLNTSYFILNRYGDAVSDYQKSVARLCLRSVTQYSADSKGYNEPYIFDYYLGSSNADDFVPPPYYHLKDIWGYFNGNAGADANGASITDYAKNIAGLSFSQLKGLCFFRNNNGSNIVLNPKTGYAKNGLLKQVVNPTGGSIQYEYEQNYGTLSSQYREVGGVHLARTKLVDGGYQNDCNNPLITHYNYVLEGSSQQSLWGLEAPKNNVSITNYYAPESKYWKFKMPFGTCNYRFQYPGIASVDMAFHYNLGQVLLINVLSPALELFSAVSTVRNIINVFNTFGRAAVLAVALDIAAGIYELIKTCFTNQSKTETTDIYYNADLNSVNPLPIQFKRVEIVEGNGANGKTVQEFTSDADYAIWHASNTLLSMKQRFASWAYGLEKKTTVYNASGNKVKEIENLYDYNSAKISFNFPKSGVPYAFPSCKAVVKKSYSQRFPYWNDANGYNAPGSYLTQSNTDMDVEIYDIFAGIVFLHTSYERVYSTSSPSAYLQTETNYSYNYYNNEVNHVTVKKSNGDVQQTYTTYSVDYNSGVLSTLNQNNMISEPVSVRTTVTKNNSSYLLHEKVTEYSQLLNGDIKPYRVLEQRFSEPVMTSYAWNYAGPGNNANNPYYKITQSFTYDAHGNLTGVRDEGNHAVSNIYDYNDRQLVASVINADPITDKPAYTSFETTSFGGWLLTGIEEYTNTGITGNRSFQMAAGKSLTAPVNIAKSYILSFWANSSGFSVSSGSLQKTVPSGFNNGFSYYEYAISEGISSVTVTGTGAIDELRIYPANARMRTVTYDPIIGKTSEADENNRITYYEYDDLARLRFIKDDKNNVVKMYEYNTVKKTAGCITTYTNLMVREVYKKNNCTSGYEGMDYVYTIPANKYQSTVSQEEVDLLVQQELLQLAQQEANTNGSCQQVFFNTAESEIFIPENCPEGMTAAGVTYSVPANRYKSFINQADAQRMALEEIKANGQEYANRNKNCVTNTNPVWEAEENASVQCELVNGYYTGHQLVYCRDVNPNSSTYNTYQWQKMDIDTTACPQNALVTYTNHLSYGVDFNVTVVNTANNATYYYTLYGGISNYNLGQLPQGVYNISITPVYQTFQFFFYNVNGLFEYDIDTVNFSNVSVGYGTGLYFDISQ